MKSVVKLSLRSFGLASLHMALCNPGYIATWGRGMVIVYSGALNTIQPVAPV